MVIQHFITTDIQATYTGKWKLSTDCTEREPRSSLFLFRSAQVKKVFIQRWWLSIKEMKYRYSNILFCHSLNTFVHYVLTYFPSIDVHELNPKLIPGIQKVTTVTPSDFFLNYSFRLHCDVTMT